jgi:uncharacterized membrane protein YidH (DUF202 family)
MENSSRMEMIAVGLILVGLIVIGGGTGTLARLASSVALEARTGTTSLPLIGAGILLVVGGLIIWKMSLQKGNKEEKKD